MAQTPMPLPDALILLGLDPHGELLTADVERAYRRHTPRAHPDRGGTREAWDLLQQARRVALEACDGVPALPPGTELVRPGDAALERMSIREIALAGQRELALVRRAQEAAATERTVIRRRTSRLARAKRQAWTMAVLAALTAGLFQVFRVITAGDAAADGVAVAAAVIAAVAGAVGALLKMRADNIAQAIEELTAMLGDVDDHGALLESVAAVGDPDGDLGAGRWWPRASLEEALHRWSVVRPDLPSRIMAPYEEFGLLPQRAELRPLAALVGPADTAELVIAKALESGTLEEARGDGGRRYTWGRRSE
ncbi:MAG: hypothetical protein JWO74_3447 [Solirubrobacterales bacterium]|nr:hypothetical protein [Solirubrobacterales bacterium]